MRKANLTAKQLWRKTMQRQLKNDQDNQNYIAEPSLVKSKISFSNVADVYLVPCMSEIADPSELYWNQDDYVRFKQEVVGEIQRKLAEV